MKTGRNLQEVLVELDRQNKAKQDFISPAQGMRLREDGHTFELNHLTTDRQMTFGTTSLFHRQVASALGIPAKYYDLMQSQKPELLAENVNAWFADRTSSYMVRSMDYGSGQVARALLSERYRRIDNMEIATSVLPLFAGNDQYEVMSCEVTENRLYLKVVNHRLEMEVRKGEAIKNGAEIIGNRTKVKIVKNKVAPPFKECEFDIMYGKGISRVGEVLDLAVDLDIIKKSGSWFSYQDQKLGQGRDKVKDILEQNPDMMKEIEEQIMALKDNLTMVSKKSKKQAKLAAAAAGAQADSADAEEATLPENDPSYDQPIEIPEEPDPDINAEDDFDEFTPV